MEEEEVEVVLYNTTNNNTNTTINNRKNAQNYSVGNCTTIVDSTYNQNEIPTSPANILSPSRPLSNRPSPSMNNTSTSTRGGNNNNIRRPPSIGIGGIGTTGGPQK